MKALIFILTTAFLIVTALVAITNLQLLMQIGAIELPGLKTNLSLLLFFALVIVAVSGGLFVLIMDAQETRLKTKKQQAALNFDARASFLKDMPLEIQTVRFQVLKQLSGS